MGPKGDGLGDSSGRVEKGCFEEEVGGVEEVGVAGVRNVVGVAAADCFLSSVTLGGGFLPLQWELPLKIKGGRSEVLVEGIVTEVGQSFVAGGAGCPLV